MSGPKSRDPYAVLEGAARRLEELVGRHGVDVARGLGIVGGVHDDAE
jgi:hypothetical protein